LAFKKFYNILPQVFHRNSREMTNNSGFILLSLIVASLTSEASARSQAVEFDNGYNGYNGYNWSGSDFDNDRHERNSIMLVHFGINKLACLAFFGDWRLSNDSSCSDRNIFVDVCSKRLCWKARDKHTSLLRMLINYGCYTIATRGQCYKTFLSGM
jgi:hypothetical protein